MNVNAEFTTQRGSTLSELSHQGSVLVVFLRHAGCTFCREALSDIRDQRSQIEENASIVLVHMGEENDASQRFFDTYGLGDLHRISDPQRRLYHAYDLQRGGVSQLLGPSVWWRGFQAAILKGHAVGKLVGDGFQMPGAFLIRDDQIIKAYRHDTAADRPDYCELAAF